MIRGELEGPLSLVMAQSVVGAIPKKGAADLTMPTRLSQALGRWATACPPVAGTAPKASSLSTLAD